jgi:hypothetical protein
MYLLNNLENDTHKFLKGIKKTRFRKRIAFLSKIQTADEYGQLPNGQIIRTKPKPYSAKRKRENTKGEQANGSKRASNRRGKR